jgi:hypothetical protein
VGLVALTMNFMPLHTEVESTNSHMHSPLPTQP